MTEVRFYHLEHQTLDKVLPGMLLKGLERGWRAVVQTSSDERAESLSAQLWSHSDENFIPHGTRSDGFAGMQPIWLTAANENPNNATVRFHVDGAKTEDIAGLSLAVIIFDGKDSDAVANAREDWKRFKAEGCEVSYWQQDEQGRWQNRAAQAAG